MNATLTAIALTPEDLLALPDGERFELVDGDLVETNVSMLSSWVGGEIFGLLREHIRHHQLGTVWPADCGLQCFADDPSRVRRPDAMFIDDKRFPIARLVDGYLREVPDLVVEVISPGDNAENLERKIGEYLDAGIRLIWVISPETRTVRVQRRDGSAARFTRHDQISGEDVILGFTCRVADLFPPVEQSVS